MPPPYDDQPPPNRPLGAAPRQGFGLNAAFQSNDGAQAGLGIAAAPAGPNAAIAPTAQQVVPQLSPAAQGTTPSPTPTPPANFNISDLVDARTNTSPPLGGGPSSGFQLYQKGTNIPAGTTGTDRQGNALFPR